MEPVPNELVDLLNDATKQLCYANEAVILHECKAQEREDAEDVEAETLANAFELLQEANAAAGIALDELKTHMGL